MTTDYVIPEFLSSPRMLERNIRKAWLGWRLWVLGELLIIAGLYFILDYRGIFGFLHFDRVLQNYSIVIAGSILVLSLVYILISFIFQAQGKFSRWVLASYSAGGKWEHIQGNGIMGAFILPLDMASEGGFVFFLVSGRLPESLFLFAFALILSFFWAHRSQRAFQGLREPIIRKHNEIKLAEAMERIWRGLSIAPDQPRAGFKDAIRKDKKSANNIAVVMEDLLLFSILILVVWRWKYYIHVFDSFSPGIPGIAVIGVLLVVLAWSVHLAFSPWRKREVAGSVIGKIRVAAKFALGVSVTMIGLQFLGFFPTLRNFDHSFIFFINLAFIAALVWIFCSFWRLIFRPIERH